MLAGAAIGDYGHREYQQVQKDEIPAQKSINVY